MAQRLQSTLRAVQGLDLQTLRCGPASITLTLAAGDPEADPERYTLDVDSKGMRIVAQTEAGLYYGAMTAAQLLSNGAAHNSSVHLPGIHIEDAPRFNEFVVQTTEDSSVISHKLAAKKIIGGFPLKRFYPELGNAAVWCCTELNSKEQIDSAAAEVR